MMALVFLAAGAACARSEPNTWSCEVEARWNRHACFPTGHSALRDYSFDELYTASSAWCFPAMTRPAAPGRAYRYTLCVSTKAECETWQKERRASQYQEPTLAPCKPYRPNQFVDLKPPDAPGG